MHRILLALESEDLEVALLDSLELDYEFSVCRSGEEVLSQRYDALILDLFLPGVDGITLLREMRCHRPPVIIVLTNLLSLDILQTLDDLGVSAVVRKPFHINRLADLLRKHVRI